MNNITQTRRNIMSMDSTELNAMIAAIKDRRFQLQVEIKNTLNVGDKVTFDYKGAKRVGTVVKRLVKNVRVESMNQIWTITPSLLTKIK